MFLRRWWRQKGARKHKKDDETRKKLGFPLFRAEKGGNCLVHEKSKLPSLSLSIRTSVKRFDEQSRAQASDLFEVSK